MGEVFRARDTRLGRSVAIKAVDSRFDTRFEREARAVSALNHPHICILYDVAENYLVMELVEGETLAERLKRGALSIEQTLLYGSQVAGALAEAHSKGVMQSIFTVCAGNTPTGQATQGRMFDLAPDGQRFLFTCRNEEAGYYTVTLDWRGFH